MKQAKRVFLIVLDSFGVGAAPDASDFGDEGANTLGRVLESPQLDIPNLTRLGLLNIQGVKAPARQQTSVGSYARLREVSKGKDTTIGHWELAGVVSPRPLPTFPEGFPPDCIAAFEKAVGRGVLCNRPYSGTAVIRDYGAEHLATGKLIVYTSADSVFQIAAHESLVPPEELYEICRKARALLTGPWGVGRVIARPFVGTGPENFTRTPNRHDFSLLPPRPTLLDEAKAAGLEVIGVGKIHDIFAGSGLTRTLRTSGNTEGIARTLELAGEDFRGLAFVNLVDFDMLYGHRRDIDGYARALSEFDRSLPALMERLGPDDLLMITADHGCDPGFTKTTDHTREYVPWLIWGRSLTPGQDLGTLEGFGAVGATAAQALGLPDTLEGRGRWAELTGEA